MQATQLNVLDRMGKIVTNFASTNESAGRVRAQLAIQPDHIGNYIAV